MNTERHQPPELTDDAVQQLAGFSPVPANGRAAFSGHIRRNVSMAWWMSSYPKAAGPPLEMIGQINNVEEAARALVGALDALGDHARKELAIFSVAGELFGFSGDDRQRRFDVQDVREMCGVDARSTICSFRKPIEKLMPAAASTKVVTRRQGRGRPSRRLDDPGNPEVTPFDLFVDAIGRSVHQAGGERLTLDRHGESGTLVKFLREVGPYLPPGFIPRALPLRRLQDLMTYWPKKSGKMF